MELTILGMNGPYPAPGSACSGYLVTQGATAVEFDLGTGTLAALTGRMAPEALDALFFTHWHFDHSSDLLPLIYRMADAVAGGGKTLTVYGPADETSPIRSIAANSPFLVLQEVRPGDTLTVGELTISVYPARHPVPAVMYRITGGEKTLCYTGDTNTLEGLVDFARGADLLLADGLFPADKWAEGKPHLSARHTAELARDAGAGQLVITHLNPNLDRHTLLKEAREIRKDAVLAECGQRYML